MLVQLLTCTSISTKPEKHRASYRLAEKTCRNADCSVTVTERFCLHSTLDAAAILSAVAAAAMAATHLYQTRACNLKDQVRIGYTV
jgi:hypothetical protein